MRIAKTDQTQNADESTLVKAVTDFMNARLLRWITKNSLRIFVHGYRGVIRHTRKAADILVQRRRVLIVP